MIATASNRRALRLCFVAPYLYPCLSGRYPVQHIGGAELQQAFLGKELHRLGLEVSYVTIDFGPPPVEDIDGIRVIKAFKERHGIPGLRFFYPRLVKLWQAMLAADADVYYTRTASFLPGVVRLFARHHGKKCIYAASSDANFDPEYLKLPSVRDRLLYEFGLRGADAIVAQTRHQERLLRRNFGLPCTVIPNFLPSRSSASVPDRNGCILWASMLRRLKQPMHFVRLAKACPDEKFVMIGGPDEHDPGTFERVEKASRTIPNLEFLGFQPYEISDDYFGRSKAIVNTSRYEGFPNTFLQAWSRGVPVISYFDPDGVIVKHRLGRVVDGEDALIAAVRQLRNGHETDPGLILRYFSDHHSPVVAERYLDLIECLQSCPRAPTT